MIKKIIRREIIPASIHQNLHPVLQRIYAARGITSINEVEHELSNLLPFNTLLNLDKAVELIAESLRLQERIIIIGDFDADGATSSALAVKALRSFGAFNVEFLVPNRFEFGYGLTPEIVNIAKKDFDPALIITVDNGIANHVGVTAAKDHGMKVVITDHHLAPETLPQADAIVNPNQPFDLFPSKNIAGVGVIFYVMLGLRRLLVEQDWFQKNNLDVPNMAHLLDLVALGTVADVVPLDRNNRILVQQGLHRIRMGKCVHGITALLEMAQRKPSRIVAADLGFAVGPRLNAAGRLEDMSLGIECLLTDNFEHAREIAKRLDELNSERRVIEQDMQEQAFFALKKFQSSPTSLPSGICLFDKEWHQGVIGILASRIKERFHRPVIAFALVNDQELKGSARSIAGIHIRDVLAEIAIQKPHLIMKFGGHAMAAGLTIPLSVFEEFRTVFSEILTTKMNDEMLCNALLSDGELRTDELTLEVAEILRSAGPWGQAFPEPLFDGIFEILDQRLVGGKHLKMTLMKDHQTFDAIAFNVDLNTWPNHRCEKVNVAFRVDVNEFRGKRCVQLIVENLDVASRVDKT